MSAIRKGSSGSKEEGGGSAPSGNGGNVKFPKNEGTSDDKVGGVPPQVVNHEGLNKSIGK